MNLDNLLMEIEGLQYVEGVNSFVVGFSTFNRPIYAFHVGDYEGKQMIMEGGIHAREYLSTLFLIEEIKYLADKYVNNGFGGGFYIIPLVNPDGVGLVLDGLDSVECESQRNILLAINNNSDDFSLWKANGLGVDLNVNFNAEWGKGDANVFCPASENFIGFYPESEREVRVILEFTKQINPDITISWHTKGEVIFYGFYMLSEQSLARDYAIAEQISKVNGYGMEKTYGSVGGYSDWVSLYLDVPAYTIEIGNSNLAHPLGEEHLSTVFEQNKDVPLTAFNAVNNLNIQQMR